APAYSKGLKGRWFGLKHMITMIVLLALGVGSMIAYRDGIQYELLFPDEYGALTVEAKIRKNNKAISRIYPQCTLFVQNKKSWKKIEGINFALKEDAAIEKTYSILRSQKKYLPEGNYLIRLDLGNEQYQTQFYLAPRSIQKKLPSEKDGHLIYMAMEKAFPRLPLNLKCTVKNLTGGKEITSDTKISIFYDNRWVPWEEFEKDKSQHKSFTSGKDYSFQFSRDGFFSKYINISVDPEQTLLNLEVKLIPLPGSLYIRSEIPALTILLNDLPYYLEGSKSPAYKMLPPLRQTGQKISLPAGEYSLTAKENIPWWKRISLFPPKLSPARSDTLKITIHQGETLNILGDVNITDGALNLKIQ
ncbi:MAG: hypothetical protein PVG39_24135, partial [Desulfobacteraceae bacterium]